MTHRGEAHSARPRAAAVVALASLVVSIVPTARAAGKPDLVEPSISSPSLSSPTRSVRRGYTIKLTDKTKNVGTARAGSSRTRYYLSKDKQRGSTDKRFTAVRSVPGLSPGQSAKATTTLTVPLTTPGALYHVIACADNTTLVRESNETNNCRASRYRMKVTTAPAAPKFTGSTPVSPTNDGTTAGVQPVLRGTAEPRATVDLFVNDAACTAPVMSATASSTGAFSFTASVPPNSTTEFRAKATDRVGNVSACSTVFRYTHDTVAPASTISGTNPTSPGKTTTPKVLGSTEPGSTVRVYDVAGCASVDQVGSAKASSSGGFAVTSTATANATNTFYVQATDPAGNSEGCLLSIQYVHDSIAPATPTLTATTPTSPSKSDRTPEVVGATDGSATIKLYLSSTCTDAPVGTGTAGGDGSFTVAVASDLPANSTSRLRAIATDTAGNASACSAGIVYVHDDRAPATSLLSTSPGSPGRSASPTVVGTAEPGATVRIFTSACAAPAATVTADSSGGFSAGIDVTENATTEFFATGTDPAGNTSTCVGPLVYTHDSIAPAVPEPNGSSPVSPSTSDTTPSITGTADSGSTVRLYTSSTCTGTLAGSGSATGGTFSVAVSVSPNTSTQYWANARDAAGNVSACSSGSMIYRHDNIAPPAPTGLSTSPAVPTNDNAPEVLGTVDSATQTVKVYNSSTCSGTPVAEGPASTFAGSGLTVSVADNTSTRFYAAALDDAGNRSACSSGVTYVEDSPQVENETVGNDESLSAEPLGTIPVVGAISPVSDVDYFSITLSEGGAIDATLYDRAGTACTGIDADLSLRSPSDAVLVADDENDVDSCSTIDGIGPSSTSGTDPAAAFLTPGTYYLRVADVGGDQEIAGYRIVFRVRTELVEVEPNNTISEADANGVVIGEDRTVRGAISAVGDKDVYRTELATDSLVHFETFDPSGSDCVGMSTVIVLQSMSIARSDVEHTGIGGCAALTALIPGGEPWYVRVEETGNDATIDQYVLEIDVLADAGAEVEPNGSSLTATPVVGSGVSIGGGHQLWDDDDYYAVSVPAGASLRAEVVETTGANLENCEATTDIDPALTLYDGSGAQVAFDDNGGRKNCSLIDGSGSAPKDGGAHQLAGGTYYLKVAKGCGSEGADCSVFDYRLVVHLR